ncbi:MAG: hypothetical protein ACREJC_14085, partial [Tepidisphaeraceae bacterium]
YHLSNNPLFQPPRIVNLTPFWTRPFLNLYVPLTYSAWMLIGLGAHTATPDPSGIYLNPTVFHVVNLIAHATCTLLVYWIVRRLTARNWAACAGALLFALHPLQVETVAWVSSFRDLLATALALASISFYLDAHPDRRGECRDARYIASLAAFALATLSKPSVIVVPPILLVIDRLVLRRSARGTVPFFVLAIPCMIWTKLLQRAPDVPPIALWQRPIVALDAIGFYLMKLIAPLNLTIDYSRTPARVLADRSTWIPCIVAGAVIAALIIIARRRPVLLCALAIFLLGLAPVLGFVPFDYQAKSTVADRYVYLPMLGIALAFAIVAAHLPRLGAACIVVVLCVLAALTMVRTLAWRDSLTLFHAAERVNPDSWAVQNNLAAMELDTNPASAEARARRVIALNPNFMWGPLHLGAALAMQNRIPDAIEVLTGAIRRWPKSAEAHAALAAALLDGGYDSVALEEYDLAVELSPGDRTIRALRDRVFRKLHPSTAP